MKAHGKCEVIGDRQTNHHKKRNRGRQHGHCGQQGFLVAWCKGFLAFNKVGTDLESCSRSEQILFPGSCLILTNWKVQNCQCTKSRACDCW